MLTMCCCSVWTDGLQVDRIIKIFSSQHPCWQECVPLFPLCVCVCVCVAANRAQSSAASSSQTGDALGKALASVSAAHTSTHITKRTRTDVRDLFSVFYSCRNHSRISFFTLPIQVKMYFVCCVFISIVLDLLSGPHEQQLLLQSFNPSWLSTLPHR